MNSTTANSCTASAESITEPSSGFAALRARYDGGAVAPGVYAIIRQLEVDIAWAEQQKVRP